MTHSTETPTTDIAQRRLLEALGELHKTLGRTEPPVFTTGEVLDPLMGLLGGLAFSEGWVREEQPEMARVFAAFGDLVTAVRLDLITQQEVSHD